MELLEQNTERSHQINPTNSRIFINKISCRSVATLSESDAVKVKEVWEILDKDKGANCLLTCCCCCFSFIDKEVVTNLEKFDAKIEKKSSNFIDEVSIPSCGSRTELTDEELIEQEFQAKISFVLSDCCCCVTRQSGPIRDEEMNEFLSVKHKYKWFWTPFKCCAQGMIASYPGQKIDENAYYCLLIFGCIDSLLNAINCYECINRSDSNLQHGTIEERKFFMSKLSFTYCPEKSIKETFIKSRKESLDKFVAIFDDENVHYKEKMELAKESPDAAKLYGHYNKMKIHDR